MSAYQVDPTTIDLMVSKAVELELYAKYPIGISHEYVTEQNAQAFGDMLWEENALSIAQRYHDGDIKTALKEAGAYKFTFYDDVTIEAAAGCARCYDYQACEHDAWNTSNARDFIIRLNEAMLKALLPRMPWGVEGDPIKQYFASKRLVRLTDLIPRRTRKAAR